MADNRCAIACPEGLKLLSRPTGEHGERQVWLESGGLGGRFSGGGD